MGERILLRKLTATALLVVALHVAPLMSAARAAEKPGWQSFRAGDCPAILAKATQRVPGGKSDVRGGELHVGVRQVM